MIAFNYDGIVAVSDNCVVPGGFHKWVSGLKFQVSGFKFEVGGLGLSLGLKLAIHQSAIVAVT